MTKFNIAKMFQGVGKEWVKVFTSKKLMPLLTKALDELSKINTPDKKITPDPYQIFNFAKATSYDNIKIVIIGQDPYPKEGDAHGLAFSSLSDKIPASLKIIYKCLLKNREIEEIPTTSNLSNWASQGVLLLNSSLTTFVGEPNAHVKIWKNFTDALIEYISNDGSCGPCPSLTFMLWGNHARKKKPLIHEDCVVYEWIHPSPLAQTNKDIQFVDCNHFTEANKLLVESMDIPPIDWNPQIEHVVFTDGACSNNGKGIFSMTGYSVYFSKGPYASMVFYGKVPPSIVDGSLIYGTNQRGECIGIIRALELILKEFQHQSEIDSNTPAATNNKKELRKSKTTIITDSNFWKDMIETYMPNWERKHIDFKTKKNSDLTIKLHELVKKVKCFSELKIIHIESHSKNPNSLPEHVKGNAIADKYAVKGKGLDSYDEVCEFYTVYT